LADNQFLALKKNKLIKTKFFAKPREKLTPIVPLIFNGCILTQQGNMIVLGQKEQGKKIKLIDIDSLILQQEYIEQRVYRTYIALICQPEVIFDLSIAA
jgi:hypothetical protein